MIFYLLCALLTLGLICIVYQMYVLMNELQVEYVDILLLVTGISCVIYAMWEYKHRRGLVYDVIVVGAGLSGLRIASNLQQAGLRVCVLEARDRVGGKMFSLNGVDHGGQWIGKHHHNMLELIRAFDLRLFESSSEFPLDKNGKFVIMWKGTPLKVNRFNVSELFRVLPRRIVSQFESAVTQLPSEPNQTMRLRDWMRLRMPSRDAQALFDVFCTNELAVSADAIQVRDMVEQMRMNPVEDFPEVWRVDGGIDQVVREMAKPLEIRLNTAVSGVKRTHETGFVVDSTDGGQYRCRRIVFALPPHLLTKVYPEGGLEGKLATSGNAIKIHITYDRPFWRENGLNGYVIFPFPTVVNSVVDNSTRDKYILGVFIVADTAVRAEKLSAVERERQVLDEVAKVLGPYSHKYLSYEEYAWSTDPWASGGWQSIARMPRLKTPNVFVVGSDYSPKWNGFFEGALISADQVSSKMLSRAF